MSHSEGAAPFFGAERLRAQLASQFSGIPLCVVANREPCVHHWNGNRIEVHFPVSGLVTALEPIVKICSGLWIAHGSGNADRMATNEMGRVLIPPKHPQYSLKRIWLSEEEEKGYYDGFANEGLWPWCHLSHTRPTFRRQDWEIYRNVNRRFAKAYTCEMAANGSFSIALIQDYHFALLPQMIRAENPHAITTLFWHIPWPNPEMVGICPWKTEIIDGMIAADLIGFHTPHYCHEFLASVERFHEARVDWERMAIIRRGHTCYVKAFPISIEWPGKHVVQPEAIPLIRTEVLREEGIAEDAIVAVGVDRLDYTKGIADKFYAVEKLLEEHPDRIGEFVLIQISAPSRSRVPRYQSLRGELEFLAKRINARFARPGYVPILHKIGSFSSEEVYRYYRAADMCIVASLQDGMNLVSKEFVASRTDENGALLLSSFAGAASELKDAFPISPYDIEGFAEMIYRVTTTDSQEIRRRMRRLRAKVRTDNVFVWASHLMDEIRRIVEERGLDGAVGLRANRKLPSFSAY